MPTRSSANGPTRRPASARDPALLKTRTGSTRAHPVDEIGPDQRGGPASKRRRTTRQADAADDGSAASGAATTGAVHDESR